LFDFKAHAAIVLASYAKGKTGLATGTCLSLEEIGDIEILRQGKVNLVEDIPPLAQLPLALQAPQAENPRSYISVPLLAQDELIGALTLEADRPRAFAPEHVDIAREVADQLAVTIRGARLFEEVLAGRERLRTLSGRLLEVQENERRHLARELHDEIGQVLTAVKINLQGVQCLPETSLLAPHLEESIGIIEHALQQVRTLSLDLRPSLLDDLGLVSALRWYVDSQARRAGFAAQFTADPFLTRLSPAIETACFRIAQEALTNVARHAHAQRVDVELRRRGMEVQLAIRDDGVGFDVQIARDHAGGMSLGLLGMQERTALVGGQIDITSGPAQGTEICVRFPLPASPDPQGAE
jgi:signal transduction histidine kinase